ncbi:MAG: hypothetical protein ACD_77C00282G0004 [uncultured bacterium]|nr:MAG: hypothetical protein ACD_77C00282G0004 [uncultured bacterium]
MEFEKEILGYLESQRSYIYKYIKYAFFRTIR